MTVSETRTAKEQAVLGGLLAHARGTPHALKISIHAGLEESWFTGSRLEAYRELRKQCENDGAPDVLTVALSLPNLEGNGHATLARWVDAGSADLLTLVRLLRDQVFVDKRLSLTKAFLAVQQVGDEANAATLADQIAKTRPAGASKISVDPDSMESIVQDIERMPDSFRSRFRLSVELDDFLCFPSAALSVIAAPTGHGKTTLLLNLLADAVETRPDRRHWLFSFEETGAVIYVKAFNARFQTNYSMSNMGSITHFLKTQSLDLIAAPLREKFKSDFLTFSQSVGTGQLNVRYGDFVIEDLLAAIRQLASDNPGVVLIDYAQLIYSGEGGRKTERTEELKRICLNLKDLAVEAGLTIIVAAQFNREVVHASRMHTRNIADAADIERSASLIVGCWNGNRGALANAAEKRGFEKFDRDALIRAEAEGGLCGTVYMKILKDRNGVSEKWATFGFRGNQLSIERTPLKAGRGWPKEIEARPVVWSATKEAADLNQERADEGWD